MNEREALLRAVCENPDDDTPRLVFADWLQENGDPERAEFIRLQVQFAALHRGSGVPSTQPSKAAPMYDPQALRKMERAIWAKRKEEFRAELPEIDGVAWFEEFHRGFVEMATISSDAQLVRRADAIFNQVPIRHITIARFSGVPGFSSLPHLRRLKTLRLVNRRANEAIARRLLDCDQLNESAMLFVQFGEYFPSPSLRTQLQKVFGDRLRGL